MEKLIQQLPIIPLPQWAQDWQGPKGVEFLFIANFVFLAAFCFLFGFCLLGVALADKEEVGSRDFRDFLGGMALFGGLIITFAFIGEHVLLFAATAGLAGLAILSGYAVLRALINIVHYVAQR